MPNLKYGTVGVHPPPTLLTNPPPQPTISHPPDHSYPPPWYPSSIRRPLPIISAVLGSLRVTKRYCIVVENEGLIKWGDKEKERKLVEGDREEGQEKEKVEGGPLPPTGPQEKSVEEGRGLEPVAEGKPKGLGIGGEGKLTTGVDFSDNGRFAAIVSQDASITVVDCQEGRVAKTVYSKKYGVGPMKYTHDSSHVLFASDFASVQHPSKRERNSQSDVIRYLSIPDNTFTQYFHGHTNAVVDLAVAPQEDIFLSSSLDGTIRLWDVRVASSTKQLPSVGRSNLAFDPTGKVLAVGGQDRSGITLYDLRHLTEGGFDHFEPQLPESDPWTSVRFANDGKKLVLGTSGLYHHIFDAFTGRRTHHPLKRTTRSLLPTGQDFTLTPDGRFLLSGNQDGTLDYWDLHSPLGLLTSSSTSPHLTCHSRSSSPDLLTPDHLPDHLPTDFLPTHHLTSHSPHPITAIGFNHRYLMMITGGLDYGLWEANLNNLYLPERDPHHTNALLSDYRPPSPPSH